MGSTRPNKGMSVRVWQDTLRVVYGPYATTIVEWGGSHGPERAKGTFQVN